jgi:hypothetical protein
MTVKAVTMEATGRFPIIPDENNSSVIMTGMVIPGANVTTVRSLIAIQVFAQFGFGVLRALREIVFFFGPHYN